MPDDIKDVAHFYNSDPEAEHRRLMVHQLEYDLTWRYLDKFLPSQSHILEIGAATGRYTVELAKRGHALTAVDLSTSLLDIARKNLTAQGLEERVQLVEADARNLSAVDTWNFDAVLLMGPLYHLIDHADRVMALNEAVERLRTGGMIFSACLSRFGTLGHLIKQKSEWIEDQVHVRSFIKRGQRPNDHPRCGFRGYSATPAEVLPLHSEVGLQCIALAGIEPIIGADDEVYNTLRGEQRRLWQDLLFEVSTEASILGASRHLLYVGRKVQE